MIDASIVERTYESGLALIKRGLAPFLLSRDDGEGKIPLRNCAACTLGVCGGPPCKLDCLTCHGFYAATFDPARWMRIVEAAPGGYLAVATGASGVLVVDIEREGLPDYEEAAPGSVHSLLTPTLTAVTPGRGLHMFYRIRDSEPIASRNRIAPYVDIKASGGYVAAPGGRRVERRWIDVVRVMADAPTELLAFLRRSVTSSGRDLNGIPATAPAGYDFVKFLADGPIGGCREFFFNDLAYRGRRNGATKEQIYQMARSAWEKAEQPPATRWHMPWRDVEYKIERVWRTVEPDVPDPELVALGRKIAGINQDGKIPMSRVTIQGSDAS